MFIYLNTNIFNIYCSPDHRCSVSAQTGKEGRRTEFLMFLLCGNEQRRKEIFYSATYSTHFIYDYM